MTVLSCALALLSGVIGAGFASGREIAFFFSSHGAYAAAAVLLAGGAMALLFFRLPAQMERSGAASLLPLCQARLLPAQGWPRCSCRCALPTAWGLPFP